MRKVILLAAILLVGINACCYGQDVDVNVNIVNGSNGEFFINGISSTQDIGGVDAEFKKLSTADSYDHYTIFLKNYNNCAVTVLCVVGFREKELDRYGHVYHEEYKERTFNVVIEAKSNRSVSLRDCVMYTKIENQTIKGMIVRRVLY